VKVLGMSWVGVKTSDFARSRTFFSEVMGLAFSYERADFAMVRLPDGDKFELFGPEGPDPEPQFRNNAVVAGFWVDDFEGAREELRASGAELLGEVKGDPGGYRWQHFRAPDGKVFELISEPARPRPR
jgi:predicted enzyme related to lactoylglutathione lyase